MTTVDALIETLAKIRNVSVSAVKDELKNDNPHTFKELHLLACAFKAVA